MGTPDLWAVGIHFYFSFIEGGTAIFSNCCMNLQEVAVKSLALSLSSISVFLLEQV